MLRCFCEFFLFSSSAVVRVSGVRVAPGSSPSHVGLDARGWARSSGEPGTQSALRGVHAAAQRPFFQPEPPENIQDVGQEGVSAGATGVQRCRPPALPSRCPPFSTTSSSSCHLTSRSKVLPTQGHLHTRTICRVRKAKGLWEREKETPAEPRASCFHVCDIPQPSEQARTTVSTFLQEETCPGS